MKKYTNNRILYDITRLVLVWLTISSVLIFATVVKINTTTEEFLRAYHSVPLMLEHILGGLAAYLAFEVICAEIQRRK